MVELYLNATGDTQFLGEKIDTLEKEILFWINNRTVDIKSHKGRSYRLARYNVEVNSFLFTLKSVET
jgi:cellobiose phosphorylase